MVKIKKNNNNQKVFAFVLIIATVLVFIVYMVRSNYPKYLLIDLRNILNLFYNYSSFNVQKSTSEWLDQDGSKPLVGYKFKKNEYSDSYKNWRLITDLFFKYNGFTKEMTTYSVDKDLSDMNYDNYIGYYKENQLDKIFGSPRQRKIYCIISNIVFCGEIDITKNSQK